MEIKAGKPNKLRKLRKIRSSLRKKLSKSLRKTINHLKRNIRRKRKTQKFKKLRCSPHQNKNAENINQHD